MVDAAEGNSDVSDVSDEFLVDAVEDTHTNGSAWMVPLQINGANITVKLDTGANVNILSEKEYKKLKHQPKLSRTNVKLTAYNGGDVPVKGQCNLKVMHKGTEYSAQFIITPAEVQSILGVEECEKLNLVRRVWAITAEIAVNERSVLNENDLISEKNLINGQVTSEKCAEQDLEHEGLRAKIVNEFEDRFKGLGCLPGEHSFTVEENATAVAEPTRKLAFPLWDSTKKILDEMVEKGVVKKVTEPTDWVHGMVVVMKKSGKPRVCMDPRNLNKVIKPNAYP